MEYRPFGSGSESWTWCEAGDGYFNSNDEDFYCPLENLTSNTITAYEIRAVDSDDNPSEISVFDVYSNNDNNLKSLFILNNTNDVDDLMGYVGDATNAFSGSNYFLDEGINGPAIGFEDGRIEIGDPNGNLDFSTPNDIFTVEANVFIPYTEGQDYRRVVSKSNQNGDGDAWAMGTDVSGGLYCMIFTEGDNYVGLETHDNYSLPTLEWVNIKCSYDSSTGLLTGYIDDVQVGQSSAPSENKTLLSSTNKLIISNTIDWSRQFHGVIDSIAIYTGLHTSSVTPTPTPTPTPPVSDTTPPEITLNNFLNGDTVVGLKDYITFAGIAEDQDGEVDSVEAYNGSTWTECPITSVPDTNQYSFTCTLENVVNGTDILVRATDSSENQNTTSPEDSWEFIYYIADEPDNNLVVNIPLHGAADYNNTTGYLEKTSLTGTLEDSTRIDSGDSVYMDGNDKIIYQDPAGNLDFLGNDSEFSATFWLKAANDMAGSDRVLMQKLNDDNSDVLWEIGVNARHQIYAKLYGEYLLKTRTPETEELEFKPGDWDDSLLLTDINEDQEWSNIKISYNKSTQSLSVRVGDKNAISEIYTLSNNTPKSTGKFCVGGACNSNDNNWIGNISDINIYNSGDSAAPSINITTEYQDRERVATTSPEFLIDFSDATGIESAEYFISFTSYDENIDSRSWVDIAFPDDGSWGETEEQYSLKVTNLPDFLWEARKPSGNTDASWYLLVRAKDLEGNFSYYNKGWITAYTPTTQYGMASYKFTTENFDTTPPDIFAHTVIPNRTTDKNPTIRGYVRDYQILNQGETASNIKSIEYKVNDGDWLSVDPLDGSFNSSSEEFNIQLSNLNPGDYTYEIRSTDSSNNTTGQGDNGSEHPNSTGTFTILNPVQVPQVESIIREVNFTTRDLQDPIYTTAVWGNGIARLRQTLSMSSTKIMQNLNGDFAQEFGDSFMNLHPATDGNLWIVSNVDKIFYFNVDSNTATTYPTTIFKADRTVKPNELYEFAVGSDRYLMVMYSGQTPNVLCHINQDPSIVIDSSQCIDYSYGLEEGESRNFQKFAVFGIDTRTSGHTGLYGVTDNDYTGDDISFAYIDTHDNPMDIDGYTVRYWGLADGIDRPGHLDSEGNPGDPVNRDRTALHFDQERGNIVMSTYGHGTFLCNDNQQPTTLPQSDSNCMRPAKEFSYLDPVYQHFSIAQDNDGRYWFGGNQGLYMFDPSGKVSTDDDLFVEIVASKDIANEAISKVAFIPGEYPVGDEIFYITRSGHLRAIETNNTPTDFKDDTHYDYQLPIPPTRQANAASWVMTDRNLSYQLSQGRGLYRIDITRSYEDANVIEFLPTPPEGMLEINNITLSEVSGSVSSDSSYTFNDLVSYEVSNDDGLTWLPITIGQTVKFDSPGYKLKVRITLSKGSTPILDYIKLNYFAYPDQDTRKIVESQIPGQSSSSSSSNSGNSQAPQCYDKSPEKAPEIVSILPDGRGQVRIYFAGAKDPVTNYTLQFGTKKNSTEFGAPDFGDRNSSEYQVRFLKPGTSYYFRVRATNGCNASAWSNEVRFTAPYFSKASIKQIAEAQSKVLNYKESNPISYSTINTQSYTKSPNLLINLRNLLTRFLGS